MLNAYTETEIRVRADQARAREAAEREAERQVEARARADALLLSFHLTGSDRPADQMAALGQRDLFRDL